jgi:hypothetical protein
MRTFVAVFAVVAMLSAPVRLTAQDVDEVGALTRRVDHIAQRALAMLKARYSEDDFHNATLLKRVAEMYARQGRYGDAEPFERRSLAVDEHMFGADNFLISNSLLPSPRWLRGGQGGRAAFCPGSGAARSRRGLAAAG